MHFIWTFILSVILSGLLVLGCGNSQTPTRAEWNYDLHNPEERHILPEHLNEISGQVIIDSITFACVQDENGILFIYDIRENEITRQIRFAEDGDYEGICKVGNDMYILRSDGELFHLANYASTDMIVTHHATGIPADNNEGLCYDQLNNRLLIGCKSKIGKGPELKDLRVVYAYDPVSGKLSSEPVFVFDVAVIIEFATQHDIRLPQREKKKGNESVFKFRTSEIAVHPLTNELYLLSASDHALLVFNQAGEIQHLKMLNEKMFNKPEGISFYDNGDMLITNEAQDHKPTLLRFIYKDPATEK